MRQNIILIIVFFIGFLIGWFIVIPTNENINENEIPEMKKYLICGKNIHYSTNGIEYHLSFHEFEEFNVYELSNLHGYTLKRIINDKEVILLDNYAHHYNPKYELAKFFIYFYKYHCN